MKKYLIPPGLDPLSGCETPMVVYLGRPANEAISRYWYCESVDARSNGDLAKARECESNLFCLSWLWLWSSWKPIFPFWRQTDHFGHSEKVSVLRDNRWQSALVTDLTLRTVSISLIGSDQNETLGLEYPGIIKREEYLYFRKNPDFCGFWAKYCVHPRNKGLRFDTKSFVLSCR